MKKKKTILYGKNNLVIKLTKHLGSNDNWWKYEIDNKDGFSQECQPKIIKETSDLGFEFDKIEFEVTDDGHNFCFTFRFGEELYELIFETPVLLSDKERLEVVNIMNPIFEMAQTCNKYEQDGIIHQYGLNYMINMNGGRNFCKKYVEYIYKLLKFNYER